MNEPTESTTDREAARIIVLLIFVVATSVAECIAIILRG